MALGRHRSDHHVAPILGMACNGRASSQRGVVLAALTNACFIAGYTLVDGDVVRLSKRRWAIRYGHFFSAAPAC